MAIPKIQYKQLYNKLNSKVSPQDSSNIMIYCNCFFFFGPNFSVHAPFKMPNLHLQINTINIIFKVIDKEIAKNIIRDNKFIYFRTKNA